MLTNDQILKAASDAFQPFKCTRAILDQDQKLKLLILDDTCTVLEVRGHPLGLLREKAGLESFLVEIRAAIEATGRTLHRWSGVRVT